MPNKITMKNYSFILSQKNRSLLISKIEKNQNDTRLKNLNISRSTLWNWKTGNGIPYKTLIKICEITSTPFLNIVNKSTLIGNRASKIFILNHNFSSNAST